MYLALPKIWDIPFPLQLFRGYENVQCLPTLLLRSDTEFEKF